MMQVNDLLYDENNYNLVLFYGILYLFFKDKNEINF